MKKRWIGLLACLAIGQVQAASFDCAKAGTKVEKLICADAELSKLDEELAKAYKDGAQRTNELDLYKQQQRAWLKERDACMDSACIKLAYENWLQGRWMPPPVQVNPSGKAPAQTVGYWLDPAPMEMIDWNWEKYPAPHDKEVCGLYLKNLRYFAQRNEPLSCGQPVAPMLKNKIKAAEWENLDPEKYPTLAREVIKLAEFRQTDPSEKEAVEAVRKHRERGGDVFRRLKFELRGSPWVEAGSNRPLPEQEYNIIQYGSDTGNPNNPNTVNRCQLVRGKRVALRDDDSPRLFIVTKDLAHVFGDVPDWRGMHINNLWIINNRVYGERYDVRGDVKLTQLRLNYPVWFKAICLYHFKKSHKE